MIKQQIIYGDDADHFNKSFSCIYLISILYFISLSPWCKKLMILLNLLCVFDAVYLCNIE